MKNHLIASEHDIQNSILEYLNATGWLAWRHNSGMISTGEGKYRRMIRMGTAGMPDVFAVKKNYPLLGIEVKKPKNKPTVAQERMLTELREHGAATIVAHSVDEVERFIKIL